MQLQPHLNKEKKKEKRKKILENCQISVEVTASLSWSFPYLSQEKEVKD